MESVKLELDKSAVIESGFNFLVGGFEVLDRMTLSENRISCVTSLKDFSSDAVGSEDILINNPSFRVESSSTLDDGLADMILEYVII